MHRGLPTFLTDRADSLIHLSTLSGLLSNVEPLLDGVWLRSEVLPSSDICCCDWLTGASLRRRGRHPGPMGLRAMLQLKRRRSNATLSLLFPQTQTALSKFSKNSERVGVLAAR